MKYNYHMGPIYVYEFIEYRPTTNQYWANIPKDLVDKYEEVKRELYALDAKIVEYLNCPEIPDSSKKV